MSTQIRSGRGRLTKKYLILAMYRSGVTQVDEIARAVGTRPSYVASVLSDAGLLQGYFDLYTTTARQMNLYSRFFARKLGFKDEAAARASIKLIDDMYRYFELRGDRAGQHHAQVMALVCLNRARWSGKRAEAAIFREWLLQHI